jgi:hypothetical protein
MASLLGGGGLTAEQQKILDYTVKNAHGAQIVMAVEGGSKVSAGYIINSDATVIGMGGFTGIDNAPSVDLLAGWKASGKLAFVLGSEARGGGRGFPTGGAAGAPPGGFGGGFGQSGPAADRTKWVQQNCKTVPASAYGGTGTQTLYNCI